MKRASSYLLLTTILLSSVMASGCARMLANSFQPPGTWQQQRARAVFFDPFPSDAGPSMVGVRPREYSKPLPEAEQNQVIPRNMLPR